MDLFTKQQNNKTNSSKLLFLESGHLDRRMQEAGAHHHHPNPSNEQITHSPSPSLPFQKKETSFDRKRILLMHRTEPLIRNDRKIRAEKGSDYVKHVGRKFSTFAPAPHHSCSLQDMQELNKRGPSFLRYCNEQTRLDHDGQLTNRTRGRGSKH
jgi:hypothetical protein